MLNPLKIARHYELNMAYPDERRLIKLLLVSAGGIVYHIIVCPALRS